MPVKNKQLRLSNLAGYLGQINDDSSPDTKIKILCGAANCLSRSGSFKTTKNAIRLYTEAYDIQSNLRGSFHTRSLNIVNLIVKCENKVEILKKNKLELHRRLKIEEEKKKKEKKEKKKKKKKEEKKEAED